VNFHWISDSHWFKFRVRSPPLLSGLSTGLKSYYYFEIAHRIRSQKKNNTSSKKRKRKSLSAPDDQILGLRLPHELCRHMAFRVWGRTDPLSGRSWPTFAALSHFRGCTSKDWLLHTWPKLTFEWRGDGIGGGGEGAGGGGRGRNNKNKGIKC